MYRNGTGLGKGAVSRSVGEDVKKERDMGGSFVVSHGIGWWYCPERSTGDGYEYGLGCESGHGSGGGCSCGCGCDCDSGETSGSEIVRGEDALLR